MKCYNCRTELIWGGDHDCEDDEDHAIVTNLSCPNCGAYCEEEKTEMAVGKGEPCNWCGKEEEDCESCS
jgi:hypothetical protein